MTFGIKKSSTDSKEKSPGIFAKLLKRNTGDPVETTSSSAHDADVQEAIDNERTSSDEPPYFPPSKEDFISACATVKNNLSSLQPGIAKSDKETFFTFLSDASTIKARTDYSIVPRYHQPSRSTLESWMRSNHKSGKTSVLQAATRTMRDYLYPTLSSEAHQDIMGLRTELKSGREGPNTWDHLAAEVGEVHDPSLIRHHSDKESVDSAERQLIESFAASNPTEPLSEGREGQEVTVRARFLPSEGITGTESPKIEE